MATRVQTTRDTRARRVETQNLSKESIQGDIDKGEQFQRRNVEYVIGAVRSCPDSSHTMFH
jgi:hypothetical protein